MDNKDMQKFLQLLGQLQKEVGPYFLYDLLGKGCFSVETPDIDEAIKIKKKYRAIGLHVDTYISQNSSGCTPDRYQCYVRLPGKPMEQILNEGKDDEF